MDVCQNLTKCRAEKRQRATWYPAAASRGPVIVGPHSPLQISDMEHLCFVFIPGSC